MEQPTSSRPDEAEPASGAEDGSSDSVHEEEEMLDRGALIDSAYRGELARVKEIIKGIETNGLDINFRGNDGSTALMCACRQGRTSVVVELLKLNGLDVNVQSGSYGWTSLMDACFYCHTDIALALLRDSRVDRHIKTSSGYNVLAVARRKGLAAVLTRLQALARGDKRMPLVKIHHRYLHGDVAAEGAQVQAQAPYPPGSAIMKALVDKNLTHHISRFLAP